ncbi:hypothetical protein HMPREF9278_0283 [Mobiluncus mulieris FB024-16]|nr:hypothetical protein HMPREF9278_0283 [Mobiluncus mulieris FB024-16]
MNPTFSGISGYGRTSTLNPGRLSWLMYHCYTRDMFGIGRKADGDG